MSQSGARKKSIIRHSVVSRDKQCSSRKFGNDFTSTATANGYDGNSESDKYFTAASSCDEYNDDFYDYDDDDDDDDGPCIRLDSDDDDQSISGFHIDLKTLQAVSSMLAHYSPVIQSDMFGNPTFVAPPPPTEDYYEEERRINYQNPSRSSAAVRRSTRLASDMSYSSTITGDDDYQFAIQELEDVLLKKDNPRLSDAMSELTDVMEKMARFTEEMDEES